MLHYHYCYVWNDVNVRCVMESTCTVVTIAYFFALALLISWTFIMLDFSWVLEMRLPHLLAFTKPAHHLRPVSYRQKTGHLRGALRYFLEDLAQPRGPNLWCSWVAADQKKSQDLRKLRTTEELCGLQTGSISATAWFMTGYDKLPFKGSRLVKWAAAGRLGEGATLWRGPGHATAQLEPATPNEGSNGTQMKIRRGSEMFWAYHRHQWQY